MRSDCIAYQSKVRNRLQEAVDVPSGRGLGPRTEYDAEKEQRIQALIAQNEAHEREHKDEVFDKRTGHAYRYSGELRQRVVDLIDAGMSFTEAAADVGVSYSWCKGVWQNRGKKGGAY
jgi:hypothetical protein